MNRLALASLLIAALSFSISIALLTLNGNSDFAHFAIIQINQAFCITINSALFYLPLFSLKYRYVKSMRKSIFNISLLVNIIYVVIVSIFLTSIGSSIYIVATSLVFILSVGFRALLRTQLNYMNKIKNVANCDFIFFGCSVGMVGLIYINDNFSFNFVILSLTFGNAVAAVYACKILGSRYFLHFYAVNLRSYSRVIRGIGLHSILSACLSEGTSNFYAYFLPIRNGADSISQISMVLLSFRPFNLLMTSKEESIRPRLRSSASSEKYSLLKQFFIFSFFVLGLNSFLVILVLYLLKWVDWGYSYDELMPIALMWVLVLCFRSVKQPLLIMCQNNGLFPKLTFHYSVAFGICIALYLCLSVSASAQYVLLMMALAESYLCLALFREINKL
jgi:hypothetical protein